jgi:hypothetical protein
MPRRLSILVATFLTATASALELRLAPAGPISTLAGARDAVRQARAAGDASPATVRIATGNYPLTEPAIFEPQDSGVSYEAEPGAQPVFLGGRKIDGWKAGADGVWTTQLEPGTTFEALWVNGQRATRARTPNDGFLFATGQPTEALPGIPLKGSVAQTMIQVKPEDAAVLGGLSTEELHDVNVLVYASWDVGRHRVAGVRVEDGTLQFTGGKRAFFSLEPWHRLHFENFRGALDAPGEWFLDRQGVLSYLPRPGEKIASAEVWVPVAAQWLVFQGDVTKDQFVEKLSFRGLRFRYQGWTLPEGGAQFGQAESGLGAAIEADGTRGLTFEGCVFAHTMTNVAWFRRGCSGIAVRHCHLHDLGAGGVKIGDPGVSKPGTDHTSHVIVEDCIMHTGGRYFPAGIGVTVFHASDVTIRHCDIADFFYTAISTGWTWGYKPTTCARILIEHCHLHHLGWAVLSDMGGVYTLGPQPGSVIRGCHIHDIGCASYGAWGMYNDEGSTGIVWENNLVHHTQSAGYHQHYGRGNVVRNNILAFGAEEHVRRSRPEDFAAFLFERNIVLMGDGRLFAHVDKNWDDGRVFLANNVYWKPGAEIPDFAGKSWADWQFMGSDTGSVVADPLFVAVEKGDWSLRPESPALKTGFVPFDWKLAGVSGDEAWRKSAARDFPPMKYGLKPKPKPLTLRDGFEGTRIGGQPSQARVHKTPADRIVVTADRPSQGQHCLQLTDGPEVEPAFEPHFYYVTNVDHGTTRVAFDVRVDAAYHLVHEWRDDAQPYNSGPMLIFQNGTIRTPEKTLAALPAGEWIHVEVTATIGSGSDATWSCTLTLPGGQAQHFDGLKFMKAAMKTLKWIGFASNGKSAAKCWLDEIEIENDLPK